MKLKFLMLSAFLASTNLWAGLDIDLIKKVTPTVTRVGIVKEKGQYYVKYESNELFNNNGDPISLIKRPRSYQRIERNFKIPVKIELVQQSEFGSIVQVLGAGDEDVKTGRFKNLSNLKLGDLFTSYDGESMIVGLGIIGGGYTSMLASNGAKLSEINATTLIPNPAYFTFGFSSGVRHVKFDLNISTEAKTVKVEYSSEKFVDNDTVEINDKVIKTESIDEILQVNLVDYLY